MDNILRMSQDKVVITADAVSEGMPDIDLDEALKKVQENDESLLALAK